ncbi:acylneuraminate cytidylyltransferase family protein [Candidatus Woesearchaeota archaeon]|jgi:CMP-N,N'-diacetyllegionaminic acid synthase|nr:acylneuraminate cytidylyltransferase family protein [Candidatus Woesearchaeota archaeon]
MINNKNILAIIPARGGSKRIPNKNMIDFNGNPLIYWSIIAGLKSKYVDSVLVSTDDENIAHFSQTLGARVPFIRPKSISEDSSSTIDVVKHAVNHMVKIGESYDYILLLQPTSPLRSSLHIDSAVIFMMEKEANAVIGVTEVDHPIEWSNTLPENLSMDSFILDKYDGIRSQDLKKRYRKNGAIYLCKLDLVLECNSLVNIPNAYGFIMDRFSSVDIDTMDDLFCALMYVKYYNNFKDEFIQ